MSDLKAVPNPNRQRPYIVTHNLILVCEALEGEAELNLKFIPDKEILDQKNFKIWIKKLTQKKWDTWEHFGHKILEKFYDTLLPSRLEMTLTIFYEDGSAQVIELTEQQPGYEPVQETKLTL